MNIKEIEERSGLTRANIRYYEQEGLLAPARRENKYRDYSEEDLETLLRVALLRSLGFSLDEIRRLQSGELELAAAMRERSAALESEGQRLLAARNVCDAISREVTSYSALRPEDYLNGFEPDAAAKQRDVAEPHPLRRYLGSRNRKNRFFSFYEWGFIRSIVFCTLFICPDRIQRIPVLLQ